MEVGVIGINHKSSDVALRELLAKAARHCFGNDLMYPWLSHVLLSTCNRTEVYFSGGNLAEFQSVILNVLRSKINAPFEHRLYSFFGEDCFTHLTEVTSGLDSAILLESDIQHQVKIAYHHACIDRNLSSAMHFMFQKCFKIAKAMRCMFQAAHSLEQMIFTLTQNFFRSNMDLNILFVGNSAVNRKILSVFFNKGFTQLNVCTRHPKSLEREAKKKGYSLLGWDHLQEWLQYDLIICGAIGDDYIIKREDVDGCHVLNSNRLILDLAVPRNVDPQIAHHPQIHLLNIDEISRLSEHSFEPIKMGCVLQKIRSEVKKQIQLFHEKSTPFQACIS